MRTLLAKLVPEHVALEQPHARSQFEHYRELADFVAHQCAPAAVRKPLWVAFTDDDDVWHPRRLETFYLGVKQVEADARVTQLRFPWFASALLC